MKRIGMMLGGILLLTGASPRRQLDRLAPGRRVVPLVGTASPTEPTDDLTEARKRHGTDAQLANLRRRNPRQRTSFSFAVIGDAEPGRFFWSRWWNPGKDAFQKQLRAVNARGPHLVMQLGDFVSKGNVKNYREYVSFLDRELKLPLFHVIGNHDRSQPNGKADKVLYHTVFGKSDYTFDHNGWRFIALDSSDYKVTDAQLDWLDRTLGAAAGKKTLIFTHIVPAYLKSRIKSKRPSHGKIGMTGLIPKGFFSEGSERFGKIVKKRGVTRVYMGHIHAYGTADYDGVKYVLSGGGGSPLYPLPPGYPKYKPAHYIWVEASPSGLHETVHTMKGEAFPVVF